MRLALVVSDHGWGHLSRSLVTGAEALRRGHALAVVASPAMAAAVTALPDTTFIPGRLDRGYVFAGGGHVDAETTRALLSEVAAGPEAGLIEAVARWAPDVVLADATPWAPSVAHAVGVPAVLCSNFSWDDQFAAIYGDTPEVRRVREQVRGFDLGLELPLGPGLPGVACRRRVPLLSRHASGALPPELATAGLAGSFVTWAMGRTDPSAQPLGLLAALGALCAARGIRIAVNEAIAPYAGAAAIPLPDASPWPDILAASRLVVTKAGYSTVAEALRGPGRLLLAGVTGLAEERAMLAEVTASGDGIGLQVADPGFEAAAVAAAQTLLDQPPRSPERAAGETAILDAVEALVAEWPARGKRD